MLPSLRRDLRRANFNAALWSMGNGLTTGSLIFYLLHDWGASGQHIGWVLALQSLVGISRLAAPRIVALLGGPKRSTIRLFVPAYLLLTALPIVGLWQPVGNLRLEFAIGLITCHQLLEGLATVALWDWLGRLVPRRIRGRYFAARQRWQLVALVPTLIAAGWFADWWRRTPHDLAWIDAKVAGYLLPIGCGTALLLASIVPLIKMNQPEPLAADGSDRRSAWRASLAAITDRRFARLLVFGCWLSFFNGIMQSAGGIFPKAALGLGVLPMLLMPTGMRVGQILLAPWVGRFSDRYGCRPTMMICQTVAACGPLFYCLASADQPWWLAGAYVAWSAYVGLNVCLPVLMLKLAQPGQFAAYAGAYFGLSGAAYGLASWGGGYLLDLFRYSTFYFEHWTFDNFRYLFWVSWIGRLLAVVLLLGIDEPGAASWRQILGKRGRPAP